MSAEDELQSAYAEDFKVAFEAAMVELGEVPDEEAATYGTRYQGIADTVIYVKGIVELMDITSTASFLDEAQTPGQLIFRGYVLGLTNVIKWAEAKSMREQFPDYPPSA